MQTQSLEAIIAELRSDDWLEAGVAIKKVLAYGEGAVSALPALFELTLHDKAPLVSDSCAIIKRLGKHGVPFLRDQAVHAGEELRAMAICLLAETGCRWATTTRLIEQLLAERNENLPEWGTDPEEIFALFRSALSDESLSVRFAAASALEEFGRHLAETVPVFMDSLQNGAEHQKNWAALHLGRIGPLAFTASTALTIATRSTCRYTALAASNALKLIGDTGRHS